MAFDSHKRKPLLYSDLFKSHRNMAVEKEEDINAISKRGGSIWSTSSNQSSSCDDSFLSDFCTPLYSDLGSIESEINGDCSVEEEEQEEDRDNRLVNGVDYEDNDAVNYNLGNGSCWNPPLVDYRTPPIQVYELKNQPSISNQSPVLQGKRVNGTESAHQYHYAQYRGTESGIHNSGSGMQAILLGGSGSRTRSSGTGVFLPHVTKDKTELKRKSGGCRMALIPTRVLRALDLHFNRLQDSTVPPLCGGSPAHSCPHDELTDSIRQENENLPEEDDVEIQLPQEWTY